MFISLANLRKLHLKRKFILKKFAGIKNLRTFATLIEKISSSKPRWWNW